VKTATKAHEANTARSHLAQMDRPLSRSRYVATVSGT